VLYGEEPADPGTPSAASPEVAFEATQPVLRTLEAPRPWWSRRGPWIAIGLVLGAVGIIAGGVIAVVSSGLGDDPQGPPAGPAAPDAAGDAVDALVALQADGAVDDAPPSEQAPGDGGGPVGFVVVKVRPSRAVVASEGVRVQAEDGTARLELPAGTRTLRIRADGYEPERRTVTVQPGDEVEVQVVLERGWGQLTVRTRRKAAVFVDGRRIGETPITRHRLRPGTYTVKAQNSRGTRQHKVRIVVGDVQTVRFPL
jgi:hypothetical protein